MQRTIAMFFISALIIVLQAGCAPTITAKNTTAENQGSQPVSNVVEADVSLGQEIVTGDIKWVVDAPEKKTTLDADNDNMEPVTADGIFIVVPLTVEVLGKETGLIMPDQLKLIDSQGRRFAADEDPYVSLTVAENLIFNKQLNPNVRTKGIVVFDVAEDAKGLRLEVNDSAFTTKGYIELGI